MNTSTTAYTILRIKRKRDDEAPEVLVVEPSTKGSKRRKSALDVFQFAETVEASAWRDAEQTRELKNRISTLSKDPQSVAPKVASDASVESPTPEVISRNPSTATSSRQYRVVTDGTDVGKRQSSRTAREPPKVLSARDLLPSSSGFKIYDAILTSPEEQDNGDPEMDKFQALLKDYLNVSDSNSALTASASTASVLTASSSEDYVYDIFYHRPSTLSDLKEAANFGTITGLPPSFDDSFDIDSGSEEEDEEDEDSNAEDFYRNDYPDEEESDENSDAGSSDMFHEYSEDEEQNERFEPAD